MPAVNLPGRLCCLVLLLCAAGGILAADTAAGHFQRGARLQAAGRFAEAQAEYEQALRLRPDHVETLANLGAVYAQQGQDQRAIQVLSRALALRPAMPPVRFALALAQFRAGRYADAHAGMAAILAAEPNNLAALHVSALALLKLERLEEAVPHLETVVAADPNNLDAASTLATTYLSLGDNAAAERVLNRRLAGSGRPEAALVRGAVLLANKEYLAALKALRQAEAGRADLPALRSYLGRTHMMLGEFDDAIREYERVLQSAPGDFNANANLGWLLTRDNRAEEALRRLEVARRSRPGDPGVLYVIGQAYQGLGRHAEAVGILEQAVAVQPDLIVAHVLLARSYSVLGRKAEFERTREIIRRLREQSRQIEERPLEEKPPEFGAPPRSSGPAR